MATKRQNITIDTEVYEKFIEIANKKGIKLSPWVTSKMKEFIEEEQPIRKSDLAIKRYCEYTGSEFIGHFDGLYKFIDEFGDEVFLTQSEVSQISRGN